MRDRQRLLTEARIRAAVIRRNAGGTYAEAERQNPYIVASNLSRWARGINAPNDWSLSLLRGETS